MKEDSNTEKHEVWNIPENSNSETVFPHLSYLYSL